MQSLVIYIFICIIAIKNTYSAYDNLLGCNAGDNSDATLPIQSEWLEYRLADLTNLSDIRALVGDIPSVPALQHPQGQ